MPHSKTTDADRIAVLSRYPGAMCVPWAMDKFAITTEVPTAPDLVATGRYEPVSTMLVAVASSEEDAWSEAYRRMQNV